MPLHTRQPHYPQQQPHHLRTSYPERYIFLVLFVIVVIRIFKVLQGYRPQDRFYSDLDELDPEAVVDTNARLQPLAIDGQAVYWEDAAGQSMGTSPGGTYHIHGRSPDDVYDTAVASLLSLQDEHSPISPIPEHRMSTIQRVQRLVAKLKTASYSAQNDPQNRLLHRQVSHLRREIANIVLSNSNGMNSLSPLPLLESVILEPPPPYSDAVLNSDDSTPVSLDEISSTSSPFVSNLSSNNM